MRIRTKLMILLLLIVFPPLVLVSGYAVKEFQGFGQELADAAETALIRTAEKNLILTLELISEDVVQHQQALKVSLTLLAKETEHLLASQSDETKNVAFDNEHTQNNVPHSSPNQREGFVPVSFYNFSNTDQKTLIEDARRLNGLAPLFSTLFLPDSASRPRGWVYLASGLACYSTGYNISMLPIFSEAFKERALKTSKQPSSVIIANPSDSQVMWDMRLSVWRYGSSLAGVVGVYEPIRGVASPTYNMSQYSTPISSLLLKVRDRPEGGRGLLIVGERSSLNQSPYWLAPKTDTWLAPLGSKVEDLILQDVLAGRSGVQNLVFQGKHVLSVYKALSDTDIILVLLAPQDTILAHADQAEDAIITRTWRILGVTATVAIFTMGAVVFLAFLGSRAVTSPVTDLALAAMRLASGDFSANVTVKGRDELSDLSRAFNVMAPQLAERLALKQDIELAREVQQNLLPQTSPTIAGLDIAARSFFCDETGGDYFDFIESPSRASYCDLVIGDATGHGISAALLMATCRALMRGRAGTHAGPGALLSQSNALLCRDTNLTGRFVTVFYLRLYAGGPDQNGKIAWARAGHDPAVIFDPVTNSFLELKGKGVPLGISPDYKYELYFRESLIAGQVLVMATDGVWEARNSVGEMFGKNRFLETVRRNAKYCAHDIVSSIHNAVRVFQADRPLEDDMTIIVVKSSAEYENDRHNVDGLQARI